MTSTELRTMSLADLATVQRRIAAELSRRLEGRSLRQQTATTYSNRQIDAQPEPEPSEFG